LNDLKYIGRFSDSNQTTYKVANLGVVHKIRSQSGLSSAERGLSDAGVRTFWCKKLRNFQNLWCARTDKVRGVEPVRTFFGQGGQIFAILFGCVIVYGRPLNMHMVHKLKGTN